jgi:integrase
MLARGYSMIAVVRQRRRGMTDKMVGTLPRKAKPYILADPEMRGHYVRVPPHGPIVFAAVARDPYGRQIWARLGSTVELTINQARDRAREVIRRIKEGKPAFEPPPVKPESVAVVVSNWLRRHVDKNNLRTADEIKRVIERYILPYWADRNFVELRRSDVAALLDVIEDKHGARTADVVLATVRSIASWVQSRDDSYTPPFAKGMRRVSKQQHQRLRILDDNELRKIWLAANNTKRIGPLVQLLLLTAQRREKLLTLRWDDIDGDGVWTIRTDEREKGNPGRLQLPKLALDIVQAQPRFVGNPHVFAGPGAKPWLVTSKFKRRLDDQSGVSDWRLHDLRRTARSLMSRAGVQSEVGERVLGHAIGGVEGIYNRHSYDAEKADALRKLAALIERIATPPGDNATLDHERHIDG